MKYYDFNKYVSYSLFSLCSINVIFFIALITLHGVKIQFSNVEKNGDFGNAITSCGFVYPLAQNVKIGQNDFSVGLGITTVNLVYTEYIVGYHKVLQKVSMAFLFLAGIWEILIVCVTVLLLYKSRDPSKEVWYLWKQNNLRITLHVLSFFGFICSLVYFGYTLNFYVSMQNTTCVPLVLYAQSYQSQTVIGGIMCFICFTVYCITIRIKSEPIITMDKQKNLQQNMWTMQANETNNEVQKMIAQRIKQLPKINDIKPIKMQEYSPPENFQYQQQNQYGHVSFFQQSNQPFNQIDKQAYTSFRPLLSHRSPQKQPPSFQNTIQQRYDQFGRVRKFIPNPVQIQQLQLDLNSKLYLIKVKQQQRLLQQSRQKYTQQNILDELLKQQQFVIRNYLPAGKKPRLKLFKNRTNKALPEFKKQWGYK